MNTAHALAQTVDTPDGPFAIVASEDQAVLASGWTGDLDAVLARIHPSLRPAAIEHASTDAATAVAAYYAGDLDAVRSVAVRQVGSALQQEGWSRLRDIAPGAPLTYTGFAASMGHPRAVRAAASVCARNAPALFVPCHRVLRADASMGGFAWGIEVKRSLLAREREIASLRSAAAGV